MKCSNLILIWKLKLNHCLFLFPTIFRADRQRYAEVKNHVANLMMIIWSWYILWSTTRPRFISVSTLFLLLYFDISFLPLHFITITYTIYYLLLSSFLLHILNLYFSYHIFLLPPWKKERLKQVEPANLWRKYASVFDDFVSRKISEFSKKTKCWKGQANWVFITIPTNIY